MHFDLVKSLSLAALIALPLAASAQSNQGPQPYNSQDPQNYGSPASQSYPQQEQGYPSQQPMYDQPQNPQVGQQQIYDAPPPLPQYDQPIAPGDGYIWTPGYWAFGSGGYFWVPGTWVLAPYDDALWTPGYWGYAQTSYFWNAGYWGPTVGYYGGINYGFGYFGLGFYGGCWRDHRFFYNSYYSHIGGGFRNVYGERFNGIRDAHPGGNSFTTASYRERNNEFRGGSYNGAGRDYNQHQAPVSRGFEARGNGTPGQPGIGRPATPGTSYSGLQRPYANPIERVPQQVAPARGDGFNGAYGRPSMPSAPAYQQRSAPQAYQQHQAPAQQQHFSAPPAQQQHFSAPSGGGGGGGGGPRGGGGGRR